MICNLLKCCILLAFAVTLTALVWGSTKEIVLYTFTGQADGGVPYGLLTFDNAGALYGTASRAGVYGHGVVFLLTHTGGTWNYSVLHSFAGWDGDAPVGQLVFDNAGNIYGTTMTGGAYNCGTIYELAPLGGGVWRESLLYSFVCGARSGNSPQSGLVLDSAGNLYGTTFSGGNMISGACLSGGGCGTVFRLKPVPGKPWKLQLLHVFSGGNDGGNPQAGVTLDAAGNVYGTTMGFGRKGFGTAYQLSYGVLKQSRFRLLHTFGSVYDGANPAAGLIFDGVGNAYGSTLSGGGSDGSSSGTVYQLTPTSRWPWNFKLLHTFTGDYTGGVQQNLVFDKDGNLYGTGGVGRDLGDGDGIFRLTPAPSGAWDWSIVYPFQDWWTEGGWPQGVILDSSSNFFGTTNAGGTYNYGVIFEVTP